MPESAEVTPKATHEAIEAGRGVLIDVREQWEYDEVRIPGATLIPLGQLPGRLDEIPGGHDVYVHCRIGARSARAVDFLRASGRPDSFNVTGGIDAWQDEGLPVER